MDNRSDKFVFVPFCMLAQAFQAQGIVKYEWRSAIKPIVNLLMDNDINIIQMPCAEAQFNGLVRAPQGITKYDTEQFNACCQQCADMVSAQIKQILDAKYQVVAILGIEQSPSCCVNYIYSNKGMQNRKGLFMQKLYDNINQYNIPIIGINRKSIKRAMNELKQVIKKSDN